MSISTAGMSHVACADVPLLPGAQVGLAGAAGALHDAVHIALCHASAAAIGGVWAGIAYPLLACRGHRGAIASPTAASASPCGSY